MVGSSPLITVVFLVSSLRTPISTDKLLIQRGAYALQLHLDCDSGFSYTSKASICARPLQHGELPRIAR